MSTPAMDWNSSPDRWLLVPLPAELKLSPPGFLRASATSSATDFAGSCGFTTSRLEVTWVRPTGAKLATGSYLRLL
ncbi:hypothetical protein D3C78_1675090 [compost metagenome]